MKAQLIATVIFLLIFLLLVIATHLLYSIGGLNPTKSRKFLHVTGGLLAMVFPSFITSQWHILLICTMAFSLLAFTYYRKWLTSVHKTERRSVGSIVFPIPVYICFLAAVEMDNNMLFYYLPVSLLTISDTLAEIGGNRWGHLSVSLLNKRKTLIGSTCFAAATLLLSVFFLVIVYKVEISKAIVPIFLLTVVTTVAELVSSKGYDNLSVPLSALLMLRLLL
jgi:dolichol kinase